MDQSKLEKYTCDTCGKQFGFNKNLKKHKRSHTAVRNEVIYSNKFKLEVLEKCKEKASEKRDASATVLKQAFSVYFGAKNMKRKKERMMLVQNKWQLRYH